MGWENSTRRARLPRDWAARRARILARDGGVCQARDSLGALCGHPANQVDHIRRGDDHSPENLQALCRWHHARKSAAEGHEALRANPRPTRARPPEPHPGMRVR